MSEDKSYWVFRYLITGHMAIKNYGDFVSFEAVCANYKKPTNIILLSKDIIIGVKSKETRGWSLSPVDILVGI